MKTIAALLHTSMIDALDARVLLRQVLGVNDVYLIAHANDVVNEAHAQQFHALVARRVAGCPVTVENASPASRLARSLALLIPTEEPRLAGFTKQG